MTGWKIRRLPTETDEGHEYRTGHAACATGAARRAQAVTPDHGGFGARRRGSAGIGAVDDDDPHRQLERAAAADRRADRLRLPDRPGRRAVTGRRRGAARHREEVADPG